jgi:hypothetical protein
LLGKELVNKSTITVVAVIAEQELDHAASVRRGLTRIRTTQLRARE